MKRCVEHNSAPPLRDDGNSRRHRLVVARVISIKVTRHVLSLSSTTQENSLMLARSLLHLSIQRLKRPTQYPHIQGICFIHHVAFLII